MLRALSFLTIAGRGSTPDGRTLRWFPLVGAAIGAVIGGIWWAADEVLPVLVVGALVVIADLVLTGMLHLDGAADSADGLLPHLERDRRLAVMAEPTAGAFAIGAVGSLLLLRTAAFASQGASVGLVIGLWCASRSVMALIATTQPYARPGGLASSFLGDRVAPVTSIIGILAAAAIVGFASGVAGIAALGGLLVASVLVLALARVRLGGFTGDVLGAIGVVGETVGLVVASGAW